MSVAVQFLDHKGMPIPKVSGSYQSAGAGFGNQLAEWVPPTQTADAALLPSLDLGNARSDDLSRNHGIASNGIQLHVDNIVGHLFRLSAKPRWKRLGISEEDARSLGSDIEAAWLEYAEDPVGCYVDAERKRTFTMMVRQAIGTHTRLGEIMAAAEWIDRPGTPYRTAIKMVSPHRVSNPYGSISNGRIRAGIETNRWGAGVAYHVRDHADNTAMSIFGDGMSQVWKRIQRETKWGRQQFIHVFEPTDDGQTRGANQFLAVMEQLHMLGKLQHTKLQNAIVNAMYAAVIESELDSSAAFEMIGSGAEGEKNITNWMTMMADYHKGANIRMNGVRIPHLVPGEQLKMHTSGNVDNGYGELESSILRWIAAGLNVPFEALARDYSKTTYSSARASMMEGWRYFMGRRKVIAGRFASMIYALWLEESIQRGIIKLPRKARFNFYEAKAAWCNAEWIGAGRMAIDGLKEVKESILKIEAGLSTYEQEMAQMGMDAQEVFAQQVREQEERKLAGLPPPSWIKMQQLDDGSPDPQSV
jgi:lambda family phage portal protein